MGDVPITYWLPTTAVKFTGAVTHNSPAHDDRELDPAVSEVSRTADVTVVTRADLAQDAFTLLVDRGSGDAETAFELTDDGRLASASATLTGVGSKVLGAAVAALGTAAAVTKLFAGDLATASLKFDGTAPTTMTLDEAYAHDFPEEAKLREAYRKTLATLLERGLTLLPAADGHDGIAGLRLATATARDELNRLDAPYLAWRERQTVSTSTALEFVLDIAQLPAESDLAHDSGTAWGTVYDALGVMVTIEPDGDLPDTFSGGSADWAAAHRRDDGAWFRRPRRVRMTLWRDVDGTPAKVRTTTADVVDAQCRHESIALPGPHWWGKHATSVTFGAAGTPTKVSGSDESVVGDVADAVAGLPKAVTDSLTQGKALLDAEAALKQKATDPAAAEIARLQQEVTLAQLRVQEKTAAKVIQLEVDLKEAELRKAEREAR
jgi:hypothetical protein